MEFFVLVTFSSLTYSWGGMDTQVIGGTNTQVEGRGTRKPTSKSTKNILYIYISSFKQTIVINSTPDCLKHFSIFLFPLKLLNTNNVRPVHSDCVHHLIRASHLPGWLKNKKLVFQVFKDYSPPYLSTLLPLLLSLLHRHKLSIFKCNHSAHISPIRGCLVKRFSKLWWRIK